MDGDITPWKSAPLRRGLEVRYGSRALGVEEGSERARGSGRRVKWGWWAFWTAYCLARAAPASQESMVEKEVSLQGRVGY